MPQPTLDIILPCYNPPTGWVPQLMAALAEVQAAIGGEAEITLILVNDGSRTGIGQHDLAQLQAALPRLQYIAYMPNYGKGHALRQGVAQARGDFQIYTDIDFPYTTASLVAVWTALSVTGADIAAGVRDADYYRHVPPIRRFISKVLRWMLGTFLRTTIADTQCGLKGFNAQGKQLFLQTRIKRFLFDLEFIFLASNAPAIRLLPVDVQLKPGIEFSKARLGILLRESINFGWIFLRGLRKRFF
jgi:glycosyltransferase involved in cell wall biosynthesis